jgi:hypothetical protein
VVSIGNRRVAGQTCSATTLRRRDKWITVGVIVPVRLAVLGA